ncbi:hypothetical protein BCAH1134_0709 [Bacillus cereus AH1134]|nr:hypothetical protein BCAH1134_0709 [Bacillus cereus AH1134]
MDVIYSYNINIGEGLLMGGSLFVYNKVKLWAVGDILTVY